MSFNSRRIASSRGTRAHTRIMVRRVLYWILGHNVKPFLWLTNIFFSCKLSTGFAAPFWAGGKNQPFGRTICHEGIYHIQKRRGAAAGPLAGQTLPLLPAPLAQKYIRLKRVKLNGKGAKRDTRLNVGDVLQLYINDEFFDKPTPENAFLSLYQPRLNILYEDENILLLPTSAPAWWCTPTRTSG